MDKPAPKQVKALRETIQRARGLGITAAQDRCAAMLHTSRRAWQQWEWGERGMHPAFWELAGIKAETDILQAQNEKCPAKRG